MNADNGVYGVRKCRGHWHVTNCGEDLAIQGDPFSTEADAQAMADRMNNGYEPPSLLSLMMAGQWSPFGPTATTVAPPPPVKRSWWQKLFVAPTDGGGANRG